MTGQAVRHAANAAIAAIRALEAGDIDTARTLAVDAATRHGEEAGYIAARGLALTYAVRHLGRLPGPHEAASYPSDGTGPAADRDANAGAMVAAAANSDIPGARRLWHLLGLHARRQLVADLVWHVARLSRQQDAGHLPDSD